MMVKLNGREVELDDNCDDNEYIEYAYIEEVVFTDDKSAVLDTDKATLETVYTVEVRAYWSECTDSSLEDLAGDDMPLPPRSVDKAPK